MSGSQLSTVFRRTLACDLAAVREAALSARNFLAEEGLAEEDLIACELALVEACNNAILYAPPQNRTLPVEIQISFQGSRIELEVVDHTLGFEWPKELELPEPEAEHGRGLFIIRSLMDEALYLRSRGENRLVMRKRSAATRQATGQRRAAPELEATQRLALSEQAISTMAKELCFRSEELAAIFRCTSELGRTNDLESFSRRLLNDLLHVAAADWFVLRLLSTDGTSLVAANVSGPELRPGPIAVPLSPRKSQARSPENSRLRNSVGSVERRAALSRQDVWFGRQKSLAPEDPLAAVKPGCAGLVRPLVMGGSVLGTLAVGRSGNEPPFSIEQVEAIHTFSDFLAIQIVNTRLRQEHLDNRLTAHELEIARKIQQSLLPKKFPVLPGFGLAGFCVSARQVGGDFYDILPLPDERALLVVADVMGKGVPAAMFAATLRTLIRTMAEWTFRPAELLGRINRLMFDELSDVDMFITASVALLDSRQRRLIVASAGHCPVLVTDRSGKIRAVSPEGMPLGILPQVPFAEETMTLNEFESSLFYSDGVTEARNAHGEFFGEQRLLTWLRQTAGQPQKAASLSEAFRVELEAFQGQIPLSDDQTFLILTDEGAPVVEEEPLVESGFGLAARASSAAL